MFLSHTQSITLNHEISRRKADWLGRVLRQGWKPTGPRPKGSVHDSPVADEVGEAPKPMRNSNTHVRDLRPLLKGAHKARVGKLMTVTARDRLAPHPETRRGSVACAPVSE